LEQITRDKESFLSNTLGIRNESDGYKVLTELRRVKLPTTEEFSLYGWGTNRDGELAI